ICFCAYLAVLPGSTVVVALDGVPAWGAWMGGALLLIQGAAVLCWLLGSYGRRGLLAALLIGLAACGLGATGRGTGFPFGRYRYTDALQPQLFRGVPLPIACAWLMVAVGAWQLASKDQRQTSNDEPMCVRLAFGPWSLVKAATLVLLLDMQIETIA